jgi:hypothetical protein
VFDREMTAEESKDWEDKVSSYRNSDKVEDQIVAILMDSSEGGFGLIEETAKKKAKVIWRLFTEL